MVCTLTLILSLLIHGSEYAGVGREVSCLTPAIHPTRERTHVHVRTLVFFLQGFITKSVQRCHTPLGGSSVSTLSSLLVALGLHFRAYLNIFSLLAVPKARSSSISMIALRLQTTTPRAQADRTDTVSRKSPSCARGMALMGFRSYRMYGDIGMSASSLHRES